MISIGLHLAALVATASSSVIAFAADDRQVFWATESELIAAPAEEGAEPVRLAEPPGSGSTSYPVAQLVLTRTHLYWRGADALWRLPRKGGRPARVARERPVTNLVTDGESVYWGTRRAMFAARGDRPPIRLAPMASVPVSLAIASGQLFWSSGLSIQRMSTRGGRIVPVHTESYTPPPPNAEERAGKPRRRASLVGVALAAGYLYFELYAYDPDCGVRRVPLGGGPSARVRGVQLIHGLTDDGFYQAEGDAIVKIPLAGGSRTTVASGLKNPSLLGVIGPWIYFQAGRAIQRVPR